MRPSPDDGGIDPMESALPGLSRVSSSFPVALAITDRVWVSVLELPHAIDVQKLRVRARAVMSCRWYIDTEIAQTAELVVGELVGNAQRHGVAPIELSVRLDESGDVLVSVSDAGRGVPRLRPIDEEAESGRGLYLVAAVSRWWRVEWRPGGGKTVTALLAADHDDGRGESG